MIKLTSIEEISVILTFVNISLIKNVTANSFINTENVDYNIIY